MRALFALLLLGMVPFAAAQSVLPPPAVSFVLEPWDAPLAPAGPAVSVPIEVRVACQANQGAPPTSVTLSVVQAPPWADLVVTPPTLSTSQPQACEDGALAFAATLTARVFTDAPAFAPEVVEIEASVVQPFTTGTIVRSMVPLTASFFSILDVSSKQSALSIAPGGEGILEIVATNFGNANTRVDVDVVPLKPGLSVEDAPPFVLQSRQAGGATVAKTLRIDVARDEGSREPIALAVRWRSSYALDPTLAGDEGELQILALSSADDRVDAASSPEEPEARVPTPGIPLVLALTLALALALRRR